MPALQGEASHSLCGIPQCTNNSGRDFFFFVKLPFQSIHYHEKNGFASEKIEKKLILFQSIHLKVPIRLMILDGCCGFVVLV